MWLYRHRRRSSPVMSLVREKLSRDLAAERLRSSRKARFSSAAEAARALGMKDVTVRAHESGQNRFDQHDAERYAAAYGVSAAWLLFGDEVGEKRTGPDLDYMIASTMDMATRHSRARIPVEGEVAPGVFRAPEALGGPISYVTVMVSGYELAKGCFAMLVGQPGVAGHYEPGRMLISAPVIEAGLRDGDHVVVRQRRAGLVEISLQQVNRTPEGVGFFPVGGGDPISPPEGPESREILGVVIADYRRRDRSGSELIPQEGGGGVI